MIDDKLDCTQLRAPQAATEPGGSLQARGAAPPGASASTAWCSDMYRKDVRAFLDKAVRGGEEEEDGEEGRLEWSEGGQRKNRTSPDPSRLHNCSGAPLTPSHPLACTACASGPAVRLGPAARGPSCERAGRQPGAGIRDRDGGAHPAPAGRLRAAGAGQV